MSLLTWELSSLVLGCVSLLGRTTLHCPFDRLGIKSTVSSSLWPLLYVMVLIMLASSLSAIAALVSSNWRSVELRNVIGFVGSLGASICRSVGGLDPCQPLWKTIIPDLHELVCGIDSWFGGQ
jgi:hypothetical protein